MDFNYDDCVVELIVEIENFSIELETFKEESVQILELKNTRTEIKDSTDGLKISKKGENLLLHLYHKIYLTPPLPVVLQIPITLELEDVLTYNLYYSVRVC